MITHTYVHIHKLQELFKKELTTKTSQFVQVARTASTNGSRGVTARDAIHEVSATILFGTWSADPSTWKSSSVNYTGCLSFFLTVHHQWTILAASPSSWQFIISQLYWLPLLLLDSSSSVNYTGCLSFFLTVHHQSTILAASPSSWQFIINELYCLPLLHPESSSSVTCTVCLFFILTELTSEIITLSPYLSS